MDDFFKQAAEEYLNALSNSLPQPEDCRHSFGKRFEKQMRHLIAKTVHPVRAAMLRAAASFAAALLLFGSVLAIDVDAWEAFFGWLMEKPMYKKPSIKSVIVREAIITPHQTNCSGKNK